ncbi:MAG: hypothetical protein IJ770_00760 [Alphaproteobacteria bacterium]|nr:hypothetical protein [Alphaproteobacteria bacterium]
MRKFVALVIGLLFLSSCRLLSYDDLNPTIQPNNRLLPILEIKPDYASIRAVYNERKDIRVADAVNIFTKEVRENIMEQTGKKKGIITMRINFEGVTMCKLCRISPFLFNLPPLIGLPANYFDQKLEIEVLILNKRRDVIRRYTESVSDTEYVALYWGYAADAAWRKVAAENMKSAMIKIRQKINNEAPQIRAELK